MPWPYAWAWRIAHRLGVPIVRDVEPESLGFQLPVPGRRR